MLTKKTIEQQIADTDIDYVMDVLSKGFRPAPYPPYPYQVATHAETAKAIREFGDIGPFIVKAAVSAGKTTLISMACRRFKQINWPAMVISRQGGIIDQDAQEIRNFSVENSVFCAGLKMKSTTFPIICGSEMTVVNALDKQLSGFYPRALLIDECHHVDVDDYVESQMTCDTYDRNSGDGTGILAARAEDSIEKMRGNGRKAYTIIIREFQRRCRERYNKELILIGYTGTEYRGTQPIINTDKKTPGLWRASVVDINTEYLVRFGAVVPTDFGDVSEDLTYDLDDFKSAGKDGDDEFSEGDMAAMEAEILQQGTLTQKIMLDVIKKTESRNGVLVTCAGHKHCEEAAAALPPGISYGIFTMATPEKERLGMLRAAYQGKCKVIFQVGCLTTGYNVPPWDTIVILRKIGSLTLIEQLIGRGMRKLKKEHENAGMVKNNNLVLDYAGAMDELADLYFSPMLEQYTYSKDSGCGETKTCPICETENGKHARRCRHEDPVTGERCEYFFVYIECEDFKNDRGVVQSKGCGAKNDVRARFCRCCGNQLYDPNKALDNEGKAYTRNDYVNVRSFSLEPTRCGSGIVLKYTLGNDGEPDYTAYEIAYPKSENMGAKQFWRKQVVDKHITNLKMRKKLYTANVDIVMENAHLFAAPLRVTHRKINGGKKDVMSKKVFFDEEGL